MNVKQMRSRGVSVSRFSKVRVDFSPVGTSAWAKGNAVVHRYNCERCVQHRFGDRHSHGAEIVVHVECRTTHLKVSGKILRFRIMFTGVDECNSRKQQGERHAMETVGIE